MRDMMDSNLTIAEVHANRVKAEEVILAALVNFQSITGVPIRDIELTQVHTVGSRHSEVVGVGVELHL